MLTPTLIMAGVAAGLITVAYFKGEQAHILGLKIGGRTFLEVLPLLLISFTVAGLIQALIPKEIIMNWLGKEAGIKGIFMGTAAGAIIPGGPYIVFPIIGSLYRAGAGIGPMVAFLVAWALWGLSRLPYEVALVGPKFALIRVVSTLIFPPIAGLIARTFFGGAT